MINMITYATKWLMRIVWLMLALLSGISGRYLLVDIQEDVGADGGAFPDGMDSYFNDITYKYLFYNKSSWLLV